MRARIARAVQTQVATIGDLAHNVSNVIQTARYEPSRMPGSHGHDQIPDRIAVPSRICSHDRIRDVELLTWRCVEGEPRGHGRNSSRVSPALRLSGVGRGRAANGDECHGWNGR